MTDPRMQPDAVATFLAHPCFVTLSRPRDSYDGHPLAWEAHFQGNGRDGRKAYLVASGPSATAAADAALARLEARELIPRGFGLDNV